MDITATYNAQDTADNKLIKGISPYIPDNMDEAPCGTTYHVCTYYLSA